MSDDLSAEEFGAFFAAIDPEGRRPFPWQERLARDVFAEGEAGKRGGAGQAWPASLDIPTGAGKTATIDIAVFHLALEAHRGAARAAPARIAFVVDRRLVVDDAYARARRIADALAGPETPGDRDERPDVLRRVAARLARFAENPADPLAVVRMRGGVPHEEDWARTPTQPTVIVSTVDQVGSRLLFRGYGVSDSMKPVHAGLLGTDTLLLLDEAHLSGPFVDTVRAAREYESETLRRDAVPLLPYAVVTLSATQAARTPFRIGADDLEHPELGRRLTASKPAQLVRVAASADSDEFLNAFVDRALRLSSLGTGSAALTAVVVNRVGRARAIHERLVKHLCGAAPADSSDARQSTALLIGRTRDVDREKMLEALLPRVRAGRNRGTTAEPLIAVATQCIEAGADLDFDAMVTELAPLDALRQRFGRLNRLGISTESRGAVLAASDQIAARAEDSIYGSALRATWGVLEGAATRVGKGKAAVDAVDFGIEATTAWLPANGALEACLAPRERAPILLPAYVERWSHTPPPAADADVALFLHGTGSGPADVEIAWRSELPEQVVRTGQDLNDALERLAACPPSGLETVAVPVGEARRWLSRQAGADLADVEGLPAPEPGRQGSQRRLRPALCWRGFDDERTRLVWPSEIRPGDLLIVPPSYNGCDHWGWDPNGTAAVRDVGEIANLNGRGRDILRVSPDLAESAWMSEGTVTRSAAQGRKARLAEALESLRDEVDADACDRLAELPHLPETWAHYLAQRDPGARKPVPIRGRDGRILALERPGVERHGRTRRARGGDARTEDDDSSRSRYRATPVLLADHARGVERMARAFAEQAGLSPALVNDIALAALLHDAGKAHPAVRRWLYGGDELAAMGPAIAKSGRLRLPAAARRLAGLPPGARHEAASVRVAMAHPAVHGASDPDLVLWLIGTHHGFGRPFFPPVAWPPDGETFEADLGDGCITCAGGPSVQSAGSGWVDLFAELKRRYGTWGLARLEVIVRLADHRQSEREESAAVGEVEGVS